MTSFHVILFTASIKYEKVVWIFIICFSHFFQIFFFFRSCWKIRIESANVACASIAMHLGRVVAGADAIGNVMCRDLLNWLEFLVLKWVYTCVHISGSGALQGSNDYYFGFASCLLDNFKETWDFVYEILWTVAMISNDVDCFPEKKLLLRWYHWNSHFCRLSLCFISK